ncbi:MAG: hypothetical protein ABIW76_05740 [Fibrobacteria bacterium]
MKQTKKKPAQSEFVKQVDRAMKRAAKAARKTARMHGTPVYFIRNGKVVAEKP